MMPERGEQFLFRVFTSKGRFHIWVEADTWEEAEELATALFEEKFGIDVKEVKRAKYETGESDETNTLHRARDTDLSDDEPWRGMRLLAGKKLWVATGQVANFEAEKIRVESAPRGAV
jgi:hypothetical protein